MVLRYSFKLEGTEIGFADGTGPNYVLSPGTKIEYDRENFNGNTANILVAGTITDTITPANGNTIIITRGETTAADYTIFEGQIKEIVQNDNNTILLRCADPLQQLKYDLFTTSYDRNIDPEAGELSAIASDIITNGGFTPSVIASGTGIPDITVDKFISNNDSRLNRLNLIQRILNWIMFYDYEARTIRLEPRGYVQYPTTLNVGAEIQNVPRWEENIENMRNKITVTGAKQLDTRVDTFSGDASETSFYLTYEPVSVNTTVGGTLQSLGIDGAQTGFDYQVDVNLKKLSFVTAPASGTNNIVCTYTTYLPTPVTGDSPASISKFGLTQHEEFDFADVVTIDDAEVRVRVLLDLLADGDVSTMLTTDEYNIRVGNEVTIADVLQPTRNGNYVVQSKVITYGSEYDVIKIGTPRLDIDAIMTSLDERLKNLEGGDRTLAAILRQLFSLVRNTITLTKKSLKLEKRNPVNTWILGHETLGYIRASQASEVDCTDNGNDGTWTGAGASTGAQYVYPTSTTTTNIFTEELVEATTSTKIALISTDTYYETSVVANYDITYLANGNSARFYDPATPLDGLSTRYDDGANSQFAGVGAYILGKSATDESLTCLRSSGALKIYDAFTNAFGSAKAYTVPAGFRVAMDYDLASDTGIFVGAGDSNGTILVVTDVTAASGQTQTYYTSYACSSPTGVCFNGAVDEIVVVDGTNKSTGTLISGYTYEPSTTTKIARTGAGTYYETTDSANYDVAYVNSTNAKWYEVTPGSTNYVDGANSQFVGVFILIGGHASGDQSLTCNRADGVLKLYDASLNTFPSTYTYTVPSGFREAMDFDLTSDTGVFVGAGDSNGTVLVVTDVTAASGQTETYYDYPTVMSSPTGVTFDGDVDLLVLVDGTRKLFIDVTALLPTPVPTQVTSIITPLQRLSCGVFNGTDHKITSTVSEASIVAVSFFIDPDTASRDIMQLDTGKVISLDGSSNVTTSGFTNATVTETAMTTGTHVYVEFDAITLTNPTVGYSTTYYDGNLDELMIFNTTLSATDITDIQENKFSKLHSKFANCKLWYSFDDPLIGDRRTNYITVFDTTY